MAKNKKEVITQNGAKKVKVEYLKGSLLAGEVREINETLAKILVKNKKIKIINE